MKILSKLILLAMFLTGCSGEPVDLVFSVEATDSMDIVLGEGTLLSIATEGATSMPGIGGSGLHLSPSQAAASAATRFQSRMNSCEALSIVVNDATMTARMDKCSGPLGLHDVYGNLTLTFSVLPDGSVTSEAIGDDILVNYALIYKINSTVERTENDGLSTLKINTGGEGFGPRNYYITRKGDYTLSYNASTDCLSLGGGWESMLGMKSWDTTVDSYTQCGSSCPEGVVEISGYTGGRAVKNTFDGSDLARWEASNGKSGTYSLFYCEPK